VGRRVTINDVAHLSKVSRATVSLVLRDSNRVSAATKERVRKVMTDVGYVYDRRAANLRAHRAMTIGLVATDVRNPYFAELTMAIEREASSAGYTLLLGYSHDLVDEQERLLSAMVEHRVDGLLLLPGSGTTARDLARTLDANGIAHVLFARRVTGHGADYVGADNVKAGQLLADHLVEQGVRSVAFVGGPQRSSARRERERGLVKKLEKHGVRVDLSLPSEASTVGGMTVTTELLERGSLPDAIVAYSDAVASGVIATLRRNGIDVGEQVAVAGFDDIPQAAMEHPALTTVATFPERIGVEAARLLIARIEDPDAEYRRVILAPELRVRASTANWTAGVRGSDGAA